MQRLLISALCGAIVLATCCSFSRAIADAPPDAQAVLAQESRWLTALLAGDRATVASILSTDPEFTHITADGRLVYRDEALASIRKQPYQSKLSEETVDFVEGVAIVHGVDTIVLPDRSSRKARFTDVFVRRNGAWQAVSAQETPVR
jgi:hypothetical protein